MSVPNKHFGNTHMLLTSHKTEKLFAATEGQKELVGWVKGEELYIYSR